MQTIRIGADEAIQAPPVGQPPLPGQQATESTSPASASPQALKGTVSEGDAIKTVEGTKISTLQPLTGSVSPSGLQGNAVPLGGMLDSTLAVELVDALLPAVLVVLMKYAGMAMKKADLQLTAKEKITLQPLVQACLNQLMINFNSPWAALGVTMTVIYGAKLAEKGFVQALDAKAERQEASKAESVVTQIKQESKSPVTMNEKQFNTAPVINMQQPGVTVSPQNWEPTPEQVIFHMKKFRANKEATIKRLKSNYAAGKKIPSK